MERDTAECPVTRGSSDLGSGVDTRSDDLPGLVRLYTYSELLLAYHSALLAHVHATELVNSHSSIHGAL